MTIGIDRVARMNIVVVILDQNADDVNDVMILLMMMMNVKTSCDSVCKGRLVACAPACNNMTVMVIQDDGDEDHCKNK